MATAVKSKNLVNNCLMLAADFVKLPVEHMWVDFDREADVLYLSFRKPQRATKTVEMDNDILIRKDGHKIVGMTILNASNR